MPSGFEGVPEHLTPCPGAPGVTASRRWQGGPWAIGFLVMLPPAIDPQALRDARRRVNLTQHDAARRVGVAGGERISRWELGTSEPRPAVLRRMAEVYGVTVDDLLTEQARQRVDVRRLRLRAGLSVRELAEATHMSVANLKRWENGQITRTPASETLEPVARSLAVSVHELQQALEQSRLGR